MRKLLLIAAGPELERVAPLLRQHRVRTLLSDGSEGLLQAVERIAADAGCGVEAHDGFTEAQPHSSSAEDVAAFFNDPGQAPPGEESAYQARGRFAAALFETFDEIPNGSLAVIGGSKVIALFLASCGGGEPSALWRSFRQQPSPPVALLRLPDLQLLEIVVAGDGSA